MFTDTHSSQVKPDNLSSGRRRMDAVDRCTTKVSVDANHVVANPPALFAGALTEHVW